MFLTKKREKCENNERVTIPQFKTNVQNKGSVTN